MAEASVFGAEEGRTVDLGPHRGVMYVGDADIMVGVFTLSPGGDPPPPHYHELQHEAVLVLEGEAELFDETRTYRAGPGTVGIVPPGVVHGLRVVGDSPLKVVGIHTPRDEAVTLLEAMSEAFRVADDPQKMMEILSRADIKLAG